ncbi:MAG TPA: GTP cyclohydrolase I [Myxococcales bacterium]|jgi:GTP cyclohydrolase I
MPKRKTSSKARSKPAAHPLARAPRFDAMQQAVRDFLVAAGLDPQEHEGLAMTPELVARAWAEEFIDGYMTDPREILAERMPAPKGKGREMVALTGLDYQSACPHHLLPYGGTAHVAYLPGKDVVGFGQMVQLLDCLGHRLVLQEDLARSVCDTLMEIVGARGVGVVLEANQACLALRGGRRAGSRAIAEAWGGDFADHAELRERFLSAIRARS